MDQETPYTFEFFPAPAKLGAYLNSFYVLRVGSKVIKEMLPAYSGQLLLAAKGTGRIDFGEGFERAPGKCFCIGPLSSASAFAIDGPALVVGASFTFHGWAALTHLPVVQNSDRFLLPQTALGKACGNSACELTKEIAKESLEITEALERLAAILEGAIAPLPQGHADLIEATYEWLSSGLSPQPETLFDKLPLSDRQIQRLVKRFFGLPPSRLKRRYRAIRAATILSDPATGPVLRSDVIDQFYDQAHMIREIREFTGRTPRLIAGDSDSMVAKTLGANGYGVVELFGGSEADQLKSR